MQNEQIFNSRYTGEEMENAFSVALAIANHNGIAKGTGNGSIQILPVDSDTLTINGERIPTSAVVAKAIAAARKVSELLVFRGIVETIDDLPADAKPGFVYIVAQEGNENYVWDGVRWTPIGNLIAPIVISSQSASYQISDSGDTVPSGEWLTEFPAVQQGKYLWTRTVIQFSVGDPLTSYSCAYIGVDGKEITVCGISADETGNVPLTADDVGAVNKAYADLAAYPVGAIYLSVNATSPADLFGGSWERLKDQFLLGAGDTYAAGSTGGESEHTLTQNEMPKHFHGAYLLGMGGTDTTPAYYAALNQSAYTYNYDQGVSGVLEAAIVGFKGGELPHNNMPPYLAVYMWKRVA